MPGYDNDGTTNSLLRPIYDNDGTTNRIIQTIYDNDGTTNRLVFVNRVYLVQSGVSRVPWDGANVEGTAATAGTFVNFGLSNVTSGDQTYTGVMSIATTGAIDMRDFTRMVFVFTQWSRDNSASGYYRTGAGVYSNRTVGRGGHNATVELPSSAVAAWKCNDHWGGTQTLNITSITSGYVGLSAGGGYLGYGSNIVSDIYME